MILSTSTVFPSQILNFWCCNFLIVSNFFKGHLQAVSKHPLQLICSTCRSNFDYSCYNWRKKKMKLKLSSEIQKKNSNCVAFSENLNFMDNLKLLVLLCIALRWAMSITDIIVNVTELYDRHNNYAGQCFVLVEIVFCCYNCLDLPWEKFFQVWVTYFPSSWEQEYCVEKRLCKFEAVGQEFVTFSRNYSCLRELGKQVTKTWKKLWAWYKSRQL